MPEYKDLVLKATGSYLAPEETGASKKPSPTRTQPERDTTSEEFRASKQTWPRQDTTRDTETQRSTTSEEIRASEET